MKQELSMSTRIFTLVFLVFCTLLAGCGAKDDPQAALEAAAQQLQTNVADKNNRAVLDQLHPQFSAQGEFNREWVQRTMLLLFMRHKNIKVLALSNNSYLDATYREKGHTEAQVGLAGAENLIPDSARHFRVNMEWWLEGDEWKLARLNWE
jgi:predicted small lipoprotein YifL